MSINNPGVGGGDTNTDISVDVAIYGATPSGIMAAVAASRSGASVILIEPTTWFGGTVSGGISHTDIAETLNKSLVVGLADEFFSKIAQEWYRITPNSYWINSYNGEPSVNLIYLRKFLAGTSTRVKINSRLLYLVKTGTKITSAFFSDLGTVKARSWIDATYEGDMAARAGCTMVIGREANATYGETHNGVTAIGSGTYQFPASVDPYVTAGVSGSGLLPFVSSGSLASAGTADGKVQAFCLRLTVTTNGSQRTAFPAPSNYNAQNYEILGRAITAGLTLNTFLDMFAATGIRGTSKYDANNRLCMSLDYVHPTECVEWITASWERRAVIAENIKQYTLGLIYFLQTDSRVSAGFKTDLANYGLCSDEFIDFGNITPQVYVREGRRMVGDYVMNETHLVLSNGVTDPVAFGYYQSDSHVVQNVVVAGAVKGEGPNSLTPPAGVPISYKILLPKATECTNLFGTNCMSTSRVAFCSFRMEPILMALGAAAGRAAAIVAARGCTAANVPYAELAVLQDYKGVYKDSAIVLDVSGVYTAGTYTETGTLTNSTAITNYIGTYSRVGTNANSSVMKFAPNITETGLYAVYVRHAVASSVDATRTPDAAIKLVGIDGTKTLVFSQKSTAASGDWDYYGDMLCAAGTPSASYVEINSVGSTLNTVVSAVKWVKRK